MKQFAFQKVEPLNYLSQAWLSDERVLIGTESGRLLMFESGELVTEFNLSEGSETRRESATDKNDRLGDGTKCSWSETPELKLTKIKDVSRLGYLGDQRKCLWSECTEQEIT